jgi:hypothetical protein
MVGGKKKPGATASLRVRGSATTCTPTSRQSELHALKNIR